MEDDDFVTKAEWAEVIRERDRRWDEEQRELYERLERNLRDNPPRAREPFDLPRMELAEEEDDDAGLADRIFLSGINKYSINLELESEED